MYFRGIWNHPAWSQAYFNSNEKSSFGNLSLFHHFNLLLLLSYLSVCLSVKKMLYCTSVQNRFLLKMKPCVSMRLPALTKSKFRNNVNIISYPSFISSGLFLLIPSSPPHPFSGTTCVSWALPSCRATAPWTRARCMMSLPALCSSSSLLFLATLQSPTSWWQARTWLGSATPAALMTETPGVLRLTSPRGSLETPSKVPSCPSFLLKYWRVLYVSGSFLLFK